MSGLGKYARSPAIGEAAACVLANAATLGGAAAILARGPLPKLIQDGLHTALHTADSRHAKALLQILINMVAHPRLQKLLLNSKQAPGAPRLKQTPYTPFLTPVDTQFVEDSSENLNLGTAQTCSFMFLAGQVFASLRSAREAFCKVCHCRYHLGTHSSSARARDDRPSVIVPLARDNTCVAGFKFLVRAAGISKKGCPLITPVYGE